ncbi:MAG: hypothetical protein ACI4FZ_02950 [Lachnospiraceae bacterium]
MKKITKRIILVIIVVAAVLGILGMYSCSGGGFGNGNGNGDGSGNGNGVENTSGNNAEENDNSKETPSTVIENTDVIIPLTKEFSVIIEKSDILYNNEMISSAQSLVDIIKKQLSEGEQALVILHDDTAVENTLEDIKNTLDKNKIPWITPTPIPSTKEK